MYSYVFIILKNFVVNKVNFSTVVISIRRTEK